MYRNMLASVSCDWETVKNVVTGNSSSKPDRTGREQSKMLNNSAYSRLGNKFDFSNLIKSATCYMKNCVPSLVDVILTNQPRLCFNSLNFGCGISDWHNMVGVAIRGAAARVEEQRTKYRSFKNFDQNVFNGDVARIPSHAAYVFDDVDDIYWAHERMLTEVINEHAPIKERKLNAKKPAFMNGDSRRAIYKKHLLFNKYKNVKPL